MPFNFVHFDVIFTIKPFFSVFPLLACQISCQLFRFCKKETSNFHVNIFSFLSECGPFSPPFACSDHRQNQQKAGSVFVQDAKRGKIAPVFPPGFEIKYAKIGLGGAK